MNERVRLAASFVIAQMTSLPINFTCYIESVCHHLVKLVVMLLWHHTVSYRIIPLW